METEPTHIENNENLIKEIISKYGLNPAHPEAQYEVLFRREHIYTTEFASENIIKEIKELFPEEKITIYKRWK